jgi:DNA-binding response OmpR family regulator
MTTDATGRKHVTILLIEDDVTLGGAFARVLRGAGYEVWHTRSADDGLEKVKIVRPDAIIVDFRMPLVNGLGFLYRLRAAESDQRTPVTVVTGDTTLGDDVHSQFQELGAAVCFKPIMPNELLDVVKGMVGDSGTHDPQQRTVW